MRSPLYAIQIKVFFFLPRIERCVKSQTRSQVTLRSAMDSSQDLIWSLFVRTLVHIIWFRVLRDSETCNAIFDIRI